jgi:hypothetical protein
MPETADKAKRHRSYRTHAVVLRRRDYADADRVVTVFTPGMGKQSLIAKGARKTTSRKAGHLELFTHANLQVAEARTWDIITEATTVEPFRHLRVRADRLLHRRRRRESGPVGVAPISTTRIGHMGGDHAKPEPRHGRCGRS